MSTQSAFSSLIAPASDHPRTGDWYVYAVEHCLWPLMNIAHRRSIHRKMRWLDRSQFLSLTQLREMQLIKLRRLIAHAYQNVPFYRARMQELGLAPGDIRSIEDLRIMPVVTKSMLKERPLDFLAHGRRLDRLVVGRTSGSTGQPTQFYRSREQDSWHWALKYRMWGMAGYRLGMPYVNIYNMKRTGWRKSLQDKLLRNRAVYIYGEASQDRLLESILRCLNDPCVQYLAGCTSTIRVFADFCHSQARMPRFNLRAILTTGSLLSPADRAMFERTLGAPVWDHYGLGGEGAHVAAECGEKNGYHVNVENLLVEPDDPAAAARGEPAGIIVTVLDNFDWPLIRYQTGDAAVFTERKCPCSRGLPLLERIDGRLSDILTLPNGARLNVHYFSVLFGRSAGIAQYQVEQVAPHRLVIRIVWRQAPLAADKQMIADDLSRMSANTLEFRFEDVAGIPLGRSGKHRYVIACQSEIAGKNETA